MPEAAQQRIRKLFNSDVRDAHLVSEFNLFDRSVTQKLWSTEFYSDQLNNLDIHRFLVLPPMGDTQSAGSTTAQAPLLDIEGYCRYLNLLLDGFFMNSMSAVDTLAHQISTVYYFPQIPRDIYIVSIKNMLVRSHSNSKLGRLLDGQLGQRWFREFEPFRHCTTHESLIRYDDIKFSFEQVTNRLRVSKIKLPDDPRVRPFTYNRNREATAYCQSILRKIQSLTTKVYESIQADIRTSNYTLPIPTP